MECMRLSKLLRDSGKAGGALRASHEHKRQGRNEHLQLQPSNPMYSTVDSKW